MKNNVEPNDLAVLVHPKFLENRDRICTVIEAWYPKPELGLPNCQWWLCEFKDPVKIVIEGNDVEFAGTEGYYTFATLRDSQLRRIANFGPNKTINKELTLEFEWVSPIKPVLAKME